MARVPMITPTTSPQPSQPFSIPTFNWSPDQELCRVFTSTPDGPVENHYEGSALAPRYASLLLHAAQGFSLPADAVAYVEVKIADAINGDGSPGNPYIPEQWETIAVLTPTRKEWLRSFPVENCRVRKPASEVPYGVVSFGIFGADGQIER